MEQKIRNLSLSSMHMTSNQEGVTINVEEVKASIKVNYDFTDENKVVRYRIDASNENDESIFKAKLEYSFEIDDDRDEGELLDEVLDLLQPRIEDIISFLTVESNTSN